MFEPDQAGTRVTLEHRGFEVHGDEGEKMREAVGGQGGWPMLLDLYATAAWPGAARAAAARRRTGRLGLVGAATLASVANARDSRVK